MKLLSFDVDANLFLPCIVDHGTILSKLKAYLKNLAMSDGVPPICVMNGLVRAGKTAALQFILPQLVKEHVPDAEFCHPNFDEFMRASSHPLDVARALLSELHQWARSAGFLVSGRTGPDNADVAIDIRALMNMFRLSGRTTYFFFDKVQRFFQEQRDPDHTLFKALL